MGKQDPDLDPDLRVKRLDASNWLKPDPTLAHFVRLTSAGAVSISPHELAERFLSIELDRAVPLSVRELFIVARAVFVYGAFFYPLYGLGQERLFMVADAAVLHRYRESGGERRANGQWPSYGRRLEALSRSGILSRQALERWQALRKLRNLSAHAEHQTITVPGQALTWLERIAREIDGLFDVREPVP